MDDAHIIAELAQLQKKSSPQEPYKIHFLGYGFGSLQADSPSGQLEIWKTHFGDMSPKLVHQTLSHGFKHTELKLTESIFTSANSTPAMMSGVGLTQHVKISPRSKIDITIRSSLNIRPNHKECILSSVEVKPEEFQAKGHSKQMVLNWIILVQKQYPQIERITLGAREIGAYAWAKFGFVPNPKHWMYLRKQMQYRKKEIEDQLTPEASKRLDEWLSSDDPKFIWKIADIPIRIEVSPTLNFMLNIEANTLPLGKFLLLKNSWAASPVDYDNGYLDLHDEQVMARLKSYFANEKHGIGFAETWTSRTRDKPPNLENIRRR